MLDYHLDPNYICWRVCWFSYSCRFAFPSEVGVNPLISLLFFSPLPRLTWYYYLILSLLIPTTQYGVVIHVSTDSNESSPLFHLLPSPSRPVRLAVRPGNSSNGGLVENTNTTNAGATVIIGSSRSISAITTTTTAAATTTTLVAKTINRRKRHGTLRGRKP